MANPSKYAASRRRALQMQKELENVKDRAVLECYARRLPPDFEPPPQTSQPLLSTSQPPHSTSQPPHSTSQPLLSTSQPPLSTSQPLLSTSSHKKLLRPLKERSFPKRPRSPNKKASHHLIHQPHLKQLAISSHHSTTGPVAHTQRPLHLPPLSSRRVKTGKKSKKSSTQVPRREPDLPEEETTLYDTTSIVREIGGLRDFRAACVTETAAERADDRERESFSNGEKSDVEMSDAGTPCDETTGFDSPSTILPHACPHSLSTRLQFDINLRLNSPSSRFSIHSHECPASSSSRLTSFPSPSPPPSSPPSPSPPPSSPPSSSPPPSSPPPSSPSPSPPPLSSPPPSSPPPSSPSPSPPPLSSPPPSPSPPPPSSHPPSSPPPSSPPPSHSPSSLSLSSHFTTATRQDHAVSMLRSPHVISSSLSAPSLLPSSSSSSSVTNSDQKSGRKIKQCAESITDDMPEPVLDGDPEENESIRGQEENESIRGQEENESIRGQEENESIRGQEENESIRGQEENENIRSMSGMDDGQQETSTVLVDPLDDENEMVGDYTHSVPESRQELHPPSSSKLVMPEVAEVLAFSAGPVSLEDVLSMHGTTINLHTHTTIPHTMKDPPTSLVRSNVVEPGMSGAIPTEKGRREGVMYLGTSQLTSHVSIHHFCTELLTAELPAAIQAFQRNIFSRRSGRRSPDKQHSTPSKISPEKPLKKTSPLVSFPKKGASDVSKKRVDHTRGGSKHTSSKPSLLSSAIAEVVIDESSISVGGKQVKIARNQLNLLWNPVPPKLSLHPHTVTTHLLPHYTHHTPSPAHTEGSLQPTTDPHVQQLNDYITEQRDGDHVSMLPPAVHSQRVKPPPVSLTPSPSNKPSPFSPGLPLRTPEVPLKPIFSLPSSSTLTPSLPSSPPPHTPPLDLAQSPSPPPSPSTSQSDTQPLRSSDNKKRHHPVKASPLGVMAFREYKVVLEEVANQRHQILEERRKRRTKTPSSGTRPRRIYRQHSRHHLKRQLSQPRLESAHSRLDLFQGRRPPRLESAHSQLDLFQGRRPPRLESAHSRLDLSQGRTGMLSRQESSMTLGSSLNLSMSASLTSRKLQRQAMQGRSGGGRKRRALFRTSSAIHRTTFAREALESSDGRCRARRASYPIATCDCEEESRSTDYRRSRTNSLSSTLNFPALMRAHGASVTSDPWEWAQGLWWEKWFSEVLRECRRALSRCYHGNQLKALIGSSIPEGGFGEEKDEVAMATVRRRARAQQSVKETAEKEEEIIELETAFPCDGDITTWEDEAGALPTELPGQLSRLSRIQMEFLEQELEQEVEEGDGVGERRKAELLSRRAVLNRKIGRLRESEHDVEESLSILPSLPSALWTRHILHLIAGKHTAALDDLRAITSSPPPSSFDKLESEGGHYFQAFIALAQQLKKAGHITAAIPLMTRAIELCPGSAECLLERGRLYDVSGEGGKAIEDYRTLLAFQPLNSEALEKMGDHYLKERQWEEAERYYSTLLLADSSLTRVRVQRAQALTHMGQHTPALHDLCSAIHLDPSDYHARFWRGCLLRHVSPQQSLRDLSVSLLLTGASHQESARIHLYRALVYIKLRCFPEALSDLLVAVTLYPSFLSAHLVSGLLHYTHLHNPMQAARCLSTALRVHPTCQAALLGRAEALKSQGKLSEAIRDYSRLIHMHPDWPTAYILRGNLFRENRDVDQAREHARIVKKLTRNEEPTAVKALVEAFLHNNEEAVVISSGLPPSTHNVILRGKLLTKACRYKEAIDLLTSLMERDPDMSKADKSECKVVLGVAHLCAGEVGDVVRLLGDKEEEEGIPRIFREVVYYTRGVALLRQGRSRAGLTDINRALVSNPQSYKAYLTRAAQFAREERLAKAILNCNEAIALKPESSRAFMYRGVLKYLSGSYRSAVEDLTRSVQLAPCATHLPLFNRALAYHAIGERDKALADYSEAVATVSFPPSLSSPLSLPLLVNRGLLCIDRGEATKALEDFTTAQQLSPEDPSILQAIGLCHHLNGSLNSALEAYTEALGLDPVFLEALVGRGDVYMDKCTDGDRERARADYCKALEICSSFEPARISLAYLLQGQGHFMEAWNKLSEGHEDEDRVRRGQKEEDRGRSEGREGSKLQEKSKTALKIDVSGRGDIGLSAAVLAARGIISLQMGHLDGAMLDLSRSIRDAPCAETLTNRGVVHCFLGDVPSAMRDYQRALTFDPNYSLTHFNIGNVLLSQRHFREAIRSFTSALGGTHDDSALVNRGLAHMMLGEEDGALTDLSAAILFNPYAAHAFFNRAHLRRSKGELEAAKQDYMRALQLVPEDWLSQYYLGRVRGELNERETATTHFEQAAHREVCGESYL